MKEPNHTVKRHIVSASVSLPWDVQETAHWEYYPAHGWLGSGLTDMNGREIYEGDKVKVWLREGEDPDIYTVEFEWGTFRLNNSMELLETLAMVDVEVVGHIAED